MDSYEFTTVVDGVDLDACEEVIADLEEDFDGLTWAQSGGQVVVTAEVAAESMIQAVLSVVEAVESVPGARVVHVGPEEYVSQAEVARRVGVSRQYVSLLASGARGPGASRCRSGGAAGPGCGRGRG